jgi:radical SAM superfamily enzyme YgiQ (UPF0313 family)
LQDTIILVELPWGRNKDPRIPLGHASLLASLNINTSCNIFSIVECINDDDFSIDRIFDRIFKLLQTKKNISTIGFGVYVWSEDTIQQLISRIRESGFRGKIVLGGPQISYCGPTLEENYPQADIFVRGYGEIALASIINHQEKIVLQGVHYAGDVDLVEQTQVDLEILPSPWLTNVIDINNQIFIRWESQRGCPFKCGFCQHKEAGARLVKKWFDTSRIQSEIEYFCQQKVQDIAILDPIFNSDQRANNVLQHFIDNDYTGRLSIQCRAEMMNDDFIEKASKLNVRLEFGLQTIHNSEGKAVNRNNNISKVETVLKKVAENEIDYEITLIFGLPKQTLASFQQTVEWCLIRKVPVIKAFPLMLLRGTEVEKRKGEWGLVESEDSMAVVLESNTFSKDDWKIMSQISEALKATEGNHPDNIEQLLDNSKTMKVDMNNYRPQLSSANYRNYP